MEPNTMRLQVTLKRRRTSSSGRWNKKSAPDEVTMTLIGTRIRPGSSKTVELFRCPVTIAAGAESVDETRYYSLPADGISLDEFWVEVERTSGNSPVTVLYNICTQPVEDEVGTVTPGKPETTAPSVVVDTDQPVEFPKVAHDNNPPKAVAKVRPVEEASSDDEEAYNDWMMDKTHAS